MKVRSIPVGIAALVVALAVGLALEMRGTSGEQPADADGQPHPYATVARALPRGDRLDAARVLPRGDRLDAPQHRAGTAAFAARFSSAFATILADVRDAAVNEAHAATPPTRSVAARHTAREHVAAAPTRSIFPPEKHTHLASLEPMGSGTTNEATNDAVLAYAAPQAPPPSTTTAQPSAPAPAADAPKRSLIPPEKNAHIASLGPSSPGASSSEPDDLDGHTAIYDISAHTLYLPDGEKLEAHSGLGSHIDDPNSVSMHNRGVTPPNVYRLALREHIFHGVRAIRLIPVGDGNMYGRDGILAHTYMLGPKGQSNGCMVVRNYSAFLQAFLSGKVERVKVVRRLTTPIPRIASSR